MQNGKATNGRTIRAKVRKRRSGAEQPVVVEKSPTKGWSEGVELWSHHYMSQPAVGEEPMSEAKPFSITKQEVWEAYQRVKANKGAARVDEESIADFEKRL
jgi:hypothetical protein